MKLIIKGFIIGLGKILPGISGSVIAISLGEYKRIINSLNSPFKKDNSIYLFKILFGMLLAIIMLSKLLFRLVNKYSFIMFTFFIGLIMGTTPNMIKKINKKNYYYIIIGFISLILVNYISFDININNYIKSFIIGIIESISTIIPGISGTAILTNLGLYKDYLLGWSMIYDLLYIKSHLSYYLPFIIGLVVTSILIIKYINIILEKYENESNGLILGFIISSIFLLLKRIDLSLNIISIFMFIIFQVIGFILGYLLDSISD